MIKEKIKLGQFFTKDRLWLKPQIKKFINQSECGIAYDPFAGDGDLLFVATNELNFEEIKGLDIDINLNWDYNDSLINIPHIDNAIIITNPPYIAKQSASRKGIDLKNYFEKSKYDDVYLIALDKMLEAQDYVVAIIPESFINSNYMNKSRLASITVLEENPFKDTENPVCVVCFDNKEKSFDKIKVYKNDKYINNLSSILDIRMNPNYTIPITFNTIDGWLGLRAIDSTDDIKKIYFDYKDNINYDWKNRIKVSSRHMTLIDINVPYELRDEFICECNRIIKSIRDKTSDVLLTPFKGNTKSGIRRRRLDFKLARAIMEEAYYNVVNKNSCEEYVKDEFKFFQVQSES